MIDNEIRTLNGLINVFMTFRYYASFENEPYFSISLLGNFLIVGVLGMAVVLLLIRLFQYLYFGVSENNRKMNII